MTMNGAFDQHFLYFILYLHLHVCVHLNLCLHLYLCEEVNWRWQWMIAFNQLCLLVRNTGLAGSVSDDDDDDNYDDADDIW